MPELTQSLVDALRDRIADPGAFLPDTTPDETMARWAARAVAAGLADGTLGYIPAAERDRLAFQLEHAQVDATAYRDLADALQATMTDPDRWDGDEAEIAIMLRYVQHLEEAVEGEAHAQGYAEAVARLRDDERYRSWWTSGGVKPDAPIRGHLADYLETVGPDGIDVESGIGVRSAGRALLEVLQYVALPFEANRAAYRLRCALGMSDAPQPVDETESSGAAARRLAGELERLLEGLAERGITPAPDCPVGTAAVDTALAAVDGLESTVRMMEGAVRLARGPAAECGAGCGEGHRYDKTCGLGPVILGPTRRLRDRPTVVEPQASEPDDDSLAWLRGLIARYGEPRLRGAGPSLTWTWPQRGVRISWTGSFGEVYAWSGKRNASLRLTAASAAADVSAVVALAGLYDNPASDDIGNFYEEPPK